MENVLIFINEILNNGVALFVIILLLNVLSSCLGHLRSIFIAKQMGKTTYYVVFIDALVYSLVLKSFTSTGISAIIAYVLGMTIGSIIGDVIEERMAMGMYDVRIFVSTQEKMYELQTLFLENGFSSTANIGMKNDMKTRCSLNIQLARRDMNKMLELIHSVGIEDPTMVVQEIKKVSGKIKKRI